MTDFPAFVEIEGAPDAGVLFICDHASNALPPAYGDLGLPPEQLARHIAWDIGAADMTRRLAAQFNAPAVLSTFSRILIDPNRGEDDPTLVRRLYDGAIVPGNARVDAAEIEARKARFFRPYRAAILARVAAMSAAVRPPAIVSLHSFTPIMQGVARPWQIGFLWDRDDRLARPLIEAFRAMGVLTGDNEPYDGALEGDTIDATATPLGLANVLVETRHDLIATREGAHLWADRLGVALAPLLARPEVRAARRYGSRARERAGRPASVA